MTRLPRSLRTNDSDLTNVDDFLCTDCSIDLSCNDDDDDNILCKFRPLTKVDYIRSFNDLPINKSMAVTRKSIDTVVVEGKQISKQEYDTRQSMGQSFESRLLFHSPSPINDDSYVDPTPLPRKDPPSPFPSPKNPISNHDSLSYSAGSFSSLVNAAQLSNDMPLQSAEDIGLRVKSNENHVYAFPAEVIVSQQMQLESLRKQVEELRGLVLSLGGKVPEKVPILSSSSSSLLSNFPDEFSVKESIKSLKIDHAYDDDKFRSSRDDFRRVDDSLEESVETGSINDDENGAVILNETSDGDINNNDEEDDLYNDTSIAMSIPTFDNILTTDSLSKRKISQKSPLGSFSISSSLSYDSVIPTIQTLGFSYDDNDNDSSHVVYSDSISSYKRDNESISFIESKYLSQK
jgi:hypothetical protein